MPDFVETSDAVLIIGATSGIGRALAIKLHEAGKAVVIAGRRQENLDELSRQLGHERVFPVQWDITDLAGIPAMVEAIAGNYGNKLNAVVIVSGIQRTTDFTTPKELDFKAIDLEITTNYTAYIHLLASWLPFLTKLGATRNPWIGIVSSSLAIVPMARTPNYNGTKAALHQLVLSVRAQLEAADSPVSLVEIFPPKVQTELHDTKHQHNLQGDIYPGMELDEFINELWQGLVEGKTDIPCGTCKQQWEMVEVPRQELFRANK